MHRTHHRAPVKRDSWYIGWKGKLGGGVKELESWKKKKNNSARVNEQESTGDGGGEKFTLFFFHAKISYRRNNRKRRLYIVERLRERKKRFRYRSIFLAFPPYAFSLGEEKGGGKVVYANPVATAKRSGRNKLSWKVVQRPRYSIDIAGGEGKQRDSANWRQLGKPCDR